MNAVADRRDQEDILYLGEYDHSLDSQCRVAIPRDWRRRNGETSLILFPGRNRDLLLHPIETLTEFISKARSMSLAGGTAQEALAWVGARSRRCICDKQGRIKIDRELLDGIGVGKQVKMVGAITHIKLCAPENWQGTQFPGEVYLDEFRKINEADNDFMRMFVQTFGKQHDG